MRARNHYVRQTLSQILTVSLSSDLEHEHWRKGPSNVVQVDRSPVDHCRTRRVIRHFPVLGALVEEVNKRCLRSRGTLWPKEEDDETDGNRSWSDIRHFHGLLKKRFLIMFGKRLIWNCGFNFWWYRQKKRQHFCKKSSFSSFFHRFRSFLFVFLIVLSFLTSFFFPKNSQVFDRILIVCRRFSIVSCQCTKSVEFEEDTEF